MTLKLKPITKKDATRQRIKRELVRRNLEFLRENVSDEELDKLRDRKDSKRLTERILDVLTSAFTKSEESLNLSYSVTAKILAELRAVKDQPVVVNITQEEKNLPESAPKEYTFSVERDSDGLIKTIRAKEIK